MIGLLLIVADVQAAPQAQHPTRIVSEAYRAASKAYDECLIDAAEKVAAIEKARLKRYGLYAQRCVGERGAVIDAWMQANPPRNAGPDGARERVEQYEWAVRRADDRASIWAGRFLDSPPTMD